MQEQKINRREILKTLVMLSIPTILEEILSTLLQYVDTAMVGHLGEKATASVSVTTTVTWLVNSIPAALGVAVLSMTAKALGSGDREYLQKIAKQILILVFACGLFAGGISVILSPYIPIWMGAEPSIWQDASDYFLIVSLPMIFRSATMIMGAAIRGTKDTKTPMLINLGANGTNILLNIVFIYGTFRTNRFGRQRSGNCVRNILYGSRIADVCCVPEKRISPLEVGTFCCGWQSDERVYANWSAGPF
mgnify:CR=1 FL=1